MKNVYHVGSGELTFDIIERIINENLKLELALESKPVFFKSPALKKGYRNAATTSTIR